MSQASLAFKAVRPFCIEFLNKRDITTLQQLRKKLKELDRDALEEIGPYVLFPFRVLIKNQDSKNDELIVEVLECLTYIFGSVIINDPSIVIEFLSQICGLITNLKSDDFGASGSEELKGGVAAAIQTLLDYASSAVRNKIYHFSNVPLLGHVVSLLLSISLENIDRSARSNALNALKSLCQPSYCVLLEESSQNAIKAIIGDCMACILPGITTALAKIIAKDTSAGHKIKSQCIDILNLFIVSTLGDNAPHTNHVTVDENTDPRLKSLIVKRDEKWVSAVSENLSPIFESVFSASNSSEWLLRLSCVKFCGKMLSECRINLKKHAQTLLKIPVKLLNDDYEQVRSFCRKILDEFSTTLQDGAQGSRVLFEILEENLYALCTSLPRLMRTSQDNEKLSTLNLLLGYLTVMKDRISTLIMSQTHLKKLSTALLHSFELDFSSIQMLDVASFGSEEVWDVTETCFRKQFKHFRNENIHKILCEICRILGKYGDSEILMDNFLEIYTTSEMNCKQALLILNQILLGIKLSDDTDSGKHHASVKTLLDEILSPENWYLVTNFESEYFQTHHLSRMQKLHDSDQKLSLVPVTSASSIKDASLKLIKSNTLLCCLHLEAILTCSKVLGKDFRYFLMHALYPLMEKTQDLDASVAACAIRSMRGVAVNCGYQSVSDLVADNSDYLISDISIQIYQLGMFPRCPAVLQAILEHSTSDILPIVSDTVDEVLTALDEHHLEVRKLLIFLPVLLAVVNAVKRWTEPEEDIEHNSPQNSNPGLKHDSSSRTEDFSNDRKDEGQKLGDGATFSHKKFVQNLKSQLLVCHKTKKIANLEDEPDIDPNWDPEKEQEETESLESPDVEKEKTFPTEIRVTRNVLTRCIHITAHEDPRVRMKVMEVVKCGISILTQHENQLLPMVHKLWSPLVARFGDKELQVVMTAFDTLCIIASYSKDFLRKRFSKEILPKILNLLKTQAKQSIGIGKSTSSKRTSNVFIPKLSPRTQDTIAFTHSLAFKLQKKALIGLGPLLESLEIRRNDHISVCVSCSSYLSTKQPIALQSAALTLFRRLIKIGRDLTWLELTRIWTPNSVLAPPLGKDLKMVFLGGNTDPHNEFASNISKLLKEC